MHTPPLTPTAPPHSDGLDEVDVTIDDASKPLPITDLPRGLPNSDGTCYLNASLQIIGNNPSLRQKLMETHPNGGFDTLLRSMDSATTSADDVKDHRDAVVAYLRGAPLEGAAVTESEALISQEGPAQSSAAINVLLDALRFDQSPIANLFLDNAEDAKGPDETIEQGYAIAVADKYIDGKRVFAAPSLFGSQAVFDMAELIGCTLTGFTYFEKGHYVAYITKDAEWYRVDDSVSTLCNVDDVKKLALAVPMAPTLDQPNPVVGEGDGYGVEVFAFS